MLLNSTERMTVLAELQDYKRLRGETKGALHTISRDPGCFLFNDSSVASDYCAIEPLVLAFSVQIPDLGRAREAPRRKTRI